MPIDSRSLLTGILQGAGSGLQKRQEQQGEFANALNKIILEARMKQALQDPNERALNELKVRKERKELYTPREWKPTTEGQYMVARGRGEGVMGQTEVGEPIYAPKLPPTMQKLKAQDTQRLLDTVKTNEIKSALIDDVYGVIDTIPQGKLGSLAIGGMQFKGTNPQLEKVQKVKMVLTDAQLLNTAKTKGAISDKEMALFSDAAANNDFSSPRIKPVLKKLKDFMQADTDAQREAYIRNYGIDPMENRKKTVGDFTPGASVSGATKSGLKYTIER